MKGKMKKVLALAVAGIMMVSLMAGCGKSAETSGSSVAAQSSAAAGSSAADSSAEAKGPDISKEVTIKWMYHGSTVTDDKAVMEKVNAYLKDKINAKLEVIWGSWADFDEKARLSINGGDDVDIYYTCSWTPTIEYATMAKRGAFARLDNPDDNLLEKVAPNLFNSLNPVLADAAMTEGDDGEVGIYAIPTYKEIAQQYTWDLNMDTLKKYGYTQDDVKDFYEFGPILEKIKKAEGKDYYPLNAETAVLERTVNNNDLVDSNSLLSYEFDPADPSKSGTEIKSRYETPAYKKFVEKMREYYKAGYISPLMANAKTMNDQHVAAQDTAKYAIGTQSYSPGYEFQAGPHRKIEVVFKPAHTAIISTTSARGAMHAISSASKNPDRALMFLNLLNTDATLFTLLEYGIEGKHYKKESDGRVTFDEGMRSSYNPWRAGMGKLSNLPVLSNEPANLWELFDKFNSEAKPVPILGWAFDQEPVKNEIAALGNIAAEYRDALNAGAVDPATKLPEYISKLKANGMDKVVAEANSQLKAFLDAKK